jgi:hypothetical protein
MLDTKLEVLMMVKFTVRVCLLSTCVAVSLAVTDNLAGTDGSRVWVERICLFDKEGEEMGRRVSEDGF